MQRLPQTVLLAILVSILSICGGCAHKSNPAGVYDLASDFSLAQDAHSVWQYGYSATRSTDPGQFRTAGATATVDGIDFWHATTDVNTGSFSGYYPYVAHNPAGKTLVGSHGWAVRPGEVAIESDGNGRYGEVRFVAPQAGDYRVTAKFEGIHFRLSTTDVHVVKNATSLFEADIDGYGGDPAYHAIVGRRPNASYQGVVALKAGDMVTFAVGYGADGSNSCDTTGLLARVERQAKKQK